MMRVATLSMSGARNAADRHTSMHEALRSSSTRDLSISQHTHTDARTRE